MRRVVLLSMVMMAASSVESAGQMLFDFEGPGGADRLTATFGTKLELSRDHVTSGLQALKMLVPAHAYPGFQGAPPVRDWSAYDQLVLDVYTEGVAGRRLGLWLKSPKAGELSKRFNFREVLQPGANRVVIPFGLIWQPARKDLWGVIEQSDVSEMGVFFGDVKEPFTAYVDNIRLARELRRIAPAPVGATSTPFDGTVVFDFQNMQTVGRDTGFFVDVEVPLADGSVRKLTLATGEKAVVRQVLTGVQMSGLRPGAAVLTRVYYLDHYETLLCVREVIPEAGQTKYLRYAPQDF